MFNDTLEITGDMTEAWFIAEEKIKSDSRKYVIIWPSGFPVMLAHNFYLRHRVAGWKIGDYKDKLFIQRRNIDG